MHACSSMSTIFERMWQTYLKKRVELCGKLFVECLVIDTFFRI